jgi:lipoprotein-anchoring transpeptidase ErfK/SrfK
VRRAGLAVPFFAACAVAGVAAAIAAAEEAPPGVTTGITETLPTPTTTVPTTTTPVPTTTTAPVPSVVPPGVSIGGVVVGGLAAPDARVALEEAFAQPIVLRYQKVTIQIAPERLGATAAYDRALTRAVAAAPNAVVPLLVRVQHRRIVAFLAKVAKRFERAPVDSQLFLRGVRPVITRSQPGTRLDVGATATAVARQLTTNRRAPITIPARPVPAKVTEKSFPSVIVIRRGKNLLSFYRGMRLVRVFGVATGQSVYPTPLGRFKIVVKWENPWWYPPASPWAKGQSPIPPGPGNPLGTRWMGLSAPGVGIHGTPDDASIGYSVSHGCIRMHISQAEWLFEHVDIGTPVFIVAA